MRYYFIVLMMAIVMSVPFGLRLASTRNRPVIDVENVSDLVQVNQLGYGAITSSSRSDDAQMLAIGMAYEIRIYHSSEINPLVIPSSQTVKRLAFHPDGNLLASSDSTGTVRIWDTSSGEEVAVWEQQGVGIFHSLYFIPNTDILAIHLIDLQEMVTSSDIGTGLRFWDYKTPSEPEMIRVPYREGMMTINNRNTLVATTYSISQNGSGLPIPTLLIRDISSGEILHQLTNIGYSFRRLIFSPTNPNLLASVDTLGVVRFWNTQEGIELFALTLVQNHITAIDFSNDGTMLATGGTDGKVRIWQVSDGSLLEVFDNQQGDIRGIMFFSLDEIYAFSDPTQMTDVWDAVTGEIVYPFTINTTPALIEGAFDPSGEGIISAGTDGSIRHWQINSGAETFTMRIDPDEWDSVTISEDGRSVAWMDTETGNIWIFDVEEGTSSLAYQTEPLYYFSDIEFSPDGTYLLLDTLGQLRIWGGEYQGGRAILDESFSAFAYSPIEPVLVYRTYEDLRWYDLRDDNLILLDNDDQDYYDSTLQFSLDGRLLATINSSNITVFDTETQLPVNEIPKEHQGGDSLPIAFHPDNSLIALANRSELQIYDITSGDLLITIDAHADDITQIFFSSDGSLIATTSLDGTIGLWGIE